METAIIAAWILFIAMLTYMWLSDMPEIAYREKQKLRDEIFSALLNEDTRQANVQRLIEEGYPIGLVREMLDYLENT